METRHDCTPVSNYEISTEEPILDARKKVARPDPEVGLSTGDNYESYS